MSVELIGQNSNKIKKAETDILKRIIKSYAEELDPQELIENKVFGLKLRMNRYLKEENNNTTSAGQFLNEILSIYNIKKSRFANYIGIEESNLHAILKGRRKINNSIAKKVELIFDIKQDMWLFIETKNKIKRFNSDNKLSKKRYSISELMG